MKLIRVCDSAGLREEFADEDAALRGAMRHFVAVGYTQQTFRMRAEFQCPLPAAAKELVAMQTFETPLQASRGVTDYATLLYLDTASRGVTDRRH